MSEKKLLTRTEVLKILAKSPVCRDPNFFEVLEIALDSENRRNFPTIMRVIDEVCGRLHVPDKNESERNMYERMMVGRVDLSGAVMKVSRIY